MRLNGARQRARVADRVRAAVLGASEAPASDLRAADPRAALGLRPARVRSVRWQPGRRATIGVAGAMVVAGAIALSWLLTSRPQQIPVTQPAGVQSTVAPQPGSGPTGPISATPAADSSTAPQTGLVAGSGAAGPPSLVVYVAGTVRHPGLYHLPPGARIYDAVQAAGGVRAGAPLGTLNLAAKIVDGQQIVVGSAGGGGPGSAGGQPEAGAASGTGGTSSGSALIDLNSATGEQLQTLPGVGPVLAQHILDWRTAHGTFTTIEQLQEVSGIGPAKFAALRNRVSI